MEIEGSPSHSHGPNRSHSHCGYLPVITFAVCSCLFAVSITAALHQLCQPAFLPGGNVSRFLAESNDNTHSHTASEAGNQPGWHTPATPTLTATRTTDSGSGYGYGNDSDSGFSRITKTSARFADLKPAPASSSAPALKGKQPARWFPAPILKQGKINKFRTRFLSIS